MLFRSGLGHHWCTAGRDRLAGQSLRKNSMTREQKLERWAQREVQRVLPEIIVEDDEGGLIAFGRYRLINENGQQAVYCYDDFVDHFTDKKTAISWCVADRLNQVKLAQNIRILDNKRRLLSADIHSRSSRAQRSRNVEFREIVRTKIAPKIQSLSALNQELEKCLNSAKYLQQKGFAK